MSDQLLNQLQREIGRLQMQVISLQGQNNGMQQQLNLLQNENIGLRARNEHLETENTRLASDLADETNNLKEKVEQIQLIKRKCQCGIFDGANTSGN